MKTSFFNKTSIMSSAFALGLLAAAPAFASCVVGCQPDNSGDSDHYEMPDFDNNFNLSTDVTGGLQGITKGDFRGIVLSGATGTGETVESQAFTREEANLTGSFGGAIATDANCGPECGDQTWDVGLDGVFNIAAGAQNVSTNSDGTATSLSEIAGDFKLGGLTAIRGDAN